MKFDKLYYGGFKMKKFICALLLICMVFVACDTGNNGNPANNNGTETISINELSVKDTSIKSLYVSNIPVNNGRAASGSTLQTLSYINSNGENSPFFFVTPSGKNIVLNVSEVQQLDNKRITINFSSYYEIIVNEDENGIITYTIGETINVGDVLNTWKTALVDMESGKVYDFTEWDIQLIKDNIIIASGYDYTIYKINFDNISVATPLNNREFFHLDSVNPKAVFNDKIIGYHDNSRYVIDLNGNFPIVSLKNMYITNDICSFISNDNPYRVEFISSRKTGWVFQDLTGDIWFFFTGGKMREIDTFSYYAPDGSIKWFNPYTTAPEKYFLGKINIDDDGQIYLTDCIEDTFSFTPGYSAGSIFIMNSNGNGSHGFIDGIIKDYAIVVICDDGFITLTREANGIQIESTALSLSLPDLYFNGKSFIKGNYFYYLDNTTIKRIHLSTGSSVENIYSNNRILTSGDVHYGYIVLSGDNIIFYQFADDNITINTYSLPIYQHNPTPKLLSTSLVEIKNIIELDF